MSKFNEGVNHFKAGYSIHYNPYRNLPTDGRYGEWQVGWEAAEVEWQRLQKHNVVN